LRARPHIGEPITVAIWPAHEQQRTPLHEQLRRRRSYHRSGVRRGRGTTLPRCRNDVGTCKRPRRGVGEVSEQNGVGPTQLRHSHIGAVHRSIAPMCLDVGAALEKCWRTL
jgi:hypothetical protein